MGLKWSILAHLETLEQKQSCTRNKAKITQQTQNAAQEEWGCNHSTFNNIKCCLQSIGQGPRTIHEAIGFISQAMMWQASRVDAIRIPQTFNPKHLTTFKSTQMLLALVNGESNHLCHLPMIAPSNAISLPRDRRAYLISQVTTMCITMQNNFSKS